MDRSVCRRACTLAVLLVAMLVGVASISSGQSTGTISGTVKDVQGGVIPGAAITLVSETRGTSISGVTGGNGDFVMTNIPVFNALNTVVYNARQTQIQWTSPENQATNINNQYNADGTLNQARLTPATAGAGAATGAQALRSMQLQVRFQF